MVHFNDEISSHSGIPLDVSINNNTKKKIYQVILFVNFKF